MKIALFGGTFDPPHLAHTKLVQAVLTQKLVDQVWYVPVAIHQQQFSKSDMLAVEHRLAMLELILTDQTKIELFEINSQQPSHTHTTLQQLQKTYPQHQFSFLMGSDQLTKLHLWNCDQDQTCFPAVADEFEYRVYPRAGFSLKLPFPNLKIVTGVEPIKLSSTEIREKISRKESVEDMVAPKVLEYISDHQLYI
jgi:nicotinate-nucleotide adenylyltransferase